MSEQISFTWKGVSDSDIEKLLTKSAEVKYAAGYKKIRRQNKFDIVPKGLYDPCIFGTMDRCICGCKLTSGRCEFCGNIVVKSEAEWIKLAGFYRMCIPYLSRLRYSEFYKSIKSLLNITAQYNETCSNIPELTRVWSNEFIITEVEDSSNAVIEKDGKYYLVEVKDADETSNLFSCGLLGLYKIISNYKGLKGDLSSLLDLINYNIVISPVLFRPMSIGYDGYPTYPKDTANYAYLIEMNERLKSIIYDKNDIPLIDKLALCSNVSSLVNLIEKESPYLQSSKSNDLRYLGTGRLTHSGRCNIISSEVKMNTVLIPLSLAYEAIQDDIKQVLSERYANSGESISVMYSTVSKEAVEICREIIEESTIVINRPPTLHRWSMLAFHGKIWDDYTLGQDADEILTMGLNTMVCKGFNADFDGDQMAFYIFTKSPQKDRIYDAMCIENNWLYEKDGSPVFQISGTPLRGLNYATKFNPPSDTTSIEYYSDFDELENAWNYGVVDPDTVVKLGERYTTYGIAKISRILGMDLHLVLHKNSINESRITTKNIHLISLYVKSIPNKCDILSQIFDLGNKFAEMYGTGSFILRELFEAEPEFPEIEEILNSDKSERQKYIELCKNLDKIVETNIKKEFPSIFNEIDEGGVKVKMPSLIAMFSPMVEYKNGQVVVAKTSLNSGYDTESMVHHLTTNREILKQKAQLVPKSGYITRQLVDMERNFIFKSELYSTDTKGIEVFKEDAIGRVTLDGTIIDELMTDNEKKDLVRIKSSIYTNAKGPEKFYIKSDEVNKNLYITRNNSAIGQSVAMSTTEAISQSQLALKHGGHLFSFCGEGLKSKSNWKLIDKFDNHIVIDDNGTKLIFPLPKNNLITKEAETNKLTDKTFIYYLDQFDYVDVNIKRTENVIATRRFSDENSLGSRNYEGIECYTINGGIIKYDFNHNTFTIGKKKYKLRSDVVYYYANGETLKPYSKFCTGSLNPGIINSMTNNLEIKFNLFYRQMKLLFKNIQLLSIELLFKGLFVFGNGTVKSAIESIDPFILIGHQKSEKALMNLRGSKLDMTLAACLLFFNDNRSLLN